MVYLYRHIINNKWKADTKVKADFVDKLITYEYIYTTVLIFHLS